MPAAARPFSLHHRHILLRVRAPPPPLCANTTSAMATSHEKAEAAQQALAQHQHQQALAQHEQQLGQHQQQEQQQLQTMKEHTQKQ